MWRECCKGNRGGVIMRRKARIEVRPFSRIESIMETIKIFKNVLQYYLYLNKIHNILWLI